MHALQTRNAILQGREGAQDREEAHAHDRGDQREQHAAEIDVVPRRIEQLRARLMACPPV